MLNEHYNYLDSSLSFLKKQIDQDLQVLDEFQQEKDNLTRRVHEKHETFVSKLNQIQEVILHKNNNKIKSYTCIILIYYLKGMASYQKRLYKSHVRKQKK